MISNTNMKFSFEETMQILMDRHSTNVGGNSEWVDWDAIYSDLLDEGYHSADASVLLDEFIDDNGYGY